MFILSNTSNRQWTNRHVQEIPYEGVSGGHWKHIWFSMREGLASETWAYNNVKSLWFPVWHPLRFQFKYMTNMCLILKDWCVSLSLENISVGPWHEPFGNERSHPESGCPHFLDSEWAFVLRDGLFAFETISVDLSSCGCVLTSKIENNFLLVRDGYFKDLMAKFSQDIDNIL